MQALHRSPPRGVESLCRSFGQNASRGLSTLQAVQAYWREAAATLRSPGGTGWQTLQCSARLLRAPRSRGQNPSKGFSAWHLPQANFCAARVSVLASLNSRKASGQTPLTAILSRSPGARGSQVVHLMPYLCLFGQSPGQKSPRPRVWPHCLHAPRAWLAASLLRSAKRWK